MSGLTLAILLAASSAPAAATEPAPAPPTAAKPAKPKKTCRPVEQSGSRLSKSICKTAEEWAAQDNAGTAKTDLIDYSRER